MKQKQKLKAQSSKSFVALLLWGGIEAGESRSFAKRDHAIAWFEGLVSAREFNLEEDIPIIIELAPGGFKDWEVPDRSEIGGAEEEE